MGIASALALDGLTLEKAACSGGGVGMVLLSAMLGCNVSSKRQDSMVRTPGAYMNEWNLEIQGNKTRQDNAKTSHMATRTHTAPHALPETAEDGEC